MMNFQNSVVPTSSKDRKYPLKEYIHETHVFV